MIVGAILIVIIGLLSSFALWLHLSIGVDRQVCHESFDGFVWGTPVPLQIAIVVPALAFGGTVKVLTLMFYFHVPAIALIVTLPPLIVGLLVVKALTGYYVCHRKRFYAHIESTFHWFCDQQMRKAQGITDDSAELDLFSFAEVEIQADLLRKLAFTLMINNNEQPTHRTDVGAIAKKTLEEARF